MPPLKVLLTEFCNADSAQRRRIIGYSGKKFDDMQNRLFTAQECNRVMTDVRRNSRIDVVRQYADW